MVEQTVGVQYFRQLPLMVVGKVVVVVVTEQQAAVVLVEGVVTEQAEAPEVLEIRQAQAHHKVIMVEQDRQQGRQQEQAEAEVLTLPELPDQLLLLAAEVRVRHLQFLVLL